MTSVDLACTPRAMAQLVQSGSEVLVIALLTASALAGVAGSPHCAGMCGGFATAAGGVAGGGVAWHIGRLGTYASLGATAALLGGAVPGPDWLPRLLAVVLVGWFSAGLAGLVRPPHLVVPGLARLGRIARSAPGLAGPLLLGIVSGLLPCGLVYAALALPAASGHPGTGAAEMVAFGLGTVPALAFAASAVHRLLEGGVWRRRALAAAVLTLGLWGVAGRTTTPDGTPACHAAR